MSIERERRTTDPLASTEGDGSSSRSIGLRWVFPDREQPITLLDSNDVLLGRGEDCDVDLVGREASRHHARIRREGPLAVLRDLGSTNGVFVNGQRVHEAPIDVGDLVRCGEWIAVVVRWTPGTEQHRPYQDAADGLYAGPILGPLIASVRRAAPSDLPIVISGETGTGKERVARAVHEWSARPGPFVGVNCAALPESLAEAELFGYRKGAFTGAEHSNRGHFRAADGGTILLDEVAELSLGMQAKLLRVIEEREVQPLGQSRSVPVDVRVVATAQEPLERAVGKGSFRADLCGRLSGLSVWLPPLRQRAVEVPYLFLRLLDKYSGGRRPAVSPRLVEQLCLDPLPFNVRQLDLLARRLLVLHGHEPVLRRAHLPARLVVPGDIRDCTDGAPQGAAEVTLGSLLSALRAHGGVVARAAAALGISRQRAYRLMHSCGGVDLAAIRQRARERGRVPS